MSHDDTVRDYELDYKLQRAIWSLEAGVGAYTVESVYAALDALEAERDRLRGVLVRIRTGEADDPRGAARAALGEQA